MKVFSRHIAACLALSILASCSSIYPDCVKDLDKAIHQRDRYEDIFSGRVSVLRKMLDEEKDPVRQYRLRQNLANEYKYYSFDTTQCHLLLNLSFAQSIRNEFMIQESRILLATNYAEAGYYPECLEIMDSINEETLPEELKADYYKSYMILSRRLRNDALTEEMHLKKHQEFNDYIQKLFPYVEENSYLWYYLKWDEASNLGNDGSRIELSLRMVETAEKGTHDYSEACNYASISYFGAGDRDEWLRWVCESLRNDIEMGAKSHLAMFAICNYFYEKNDIPRAFRYTLEYGLSDAVAYNGRFNVWKLSSLSNKVQQRYQQVERLDRILLQVMLAVAVILVIVCLILLAKVSRRNGELKYARGNLEDSNKVKEEYIRSFLTMISDNIDDRRKYDNHILQTVRQGHVSSLIEEIEKKSENDTDIDTFNSLFDSTFLGLYPDFVEKFNSLLKDGETIIPRSKGSLTPELRIFAMSKLGITDSNIVASLLHYSPNTIYNYRVKVYGKAKKPKEAFIDDFSRL